MAFQSIVEGLFTGLSTDALELIEAFRLVPALAFGELCVEFLVSESKSSRVTT